ncbi:YeeE/YedE family protein [Rhodobacteraceae bacterium D3-12]|nr:YeeE/YedE family protein [Rhodobacteraceae bacterium D3-12]
MRFILPYLTGLVFGVGISISGMANPAKVLNFFDIAGAWGPSLIMVMGGALVTTFIGYRLVFRRPAPLLEAGFNLPGSRVIDAKLVGGSAVFGIGWGISGFCPGGALPVLGTGRWEVFAFTGALVVGIFLARALQSFAAGANRAST